MQGVVGTVKSNFEGIIQPLKLFGIEAASQDKCATGKQYMKELGRKESQRYK